MTDNGSPDHGHVLRWRRRGSVLEGLVSRESGGRVTTEWQAALVFDDPDGAGTAPAEVAP